MIIPSIDLIKGKLVQLKQGKEKVIELANPREFAQKYSLYTKIQLIDLDAAFGEGDNFELVKEICKFAECRVGGGIRTIQKAKELIDAGASKLIIGTKANKEFLIELMREIGKEKIIVALDAKQGNISIQGWRVQNGKTVLELAEELKDYCSEFLYTCIEKEGMMSGIDIDTVFKLKNMTKNKISFAGGISNYEEINQLNTLGVDAIVGMAIYTGKIDPIYSFICSLDFEKMNGLIPTIIKDEQGSILILAYSSKDSLKKAIETRQGWYFSRERNKLWMKGETSGNTQELIDVKIDCDKDALLFIVKQKGNACHTNEYSCFGEEKKFNLQSLYEKIQERIKKPSPSSYTSKLVKNPNFLRRKIVEEAAEVITENTQNKQRLTEEIADLMYNILVYMAANKISIEDIDAENLKRDKETLINASNLNTEAKEEKWNQ